MNHNVMLMLEALRNSSNECTRASVRIILANEPVGPKGIPARDMAAAGFYGDFLQAVMTGDYLDAYGAADTSNQCALRSVLGTRDDLW